MMMSDRPTQTRGNDHFTYCPRRSGGQGLQSFARAPRQALQDPRGRAGMKMGTGSIILAKCIHCTFTTVLLLYYYCTSTTILLLLLLLPLLLLLLLLYFYYCTSTTVLVLP